MNDLDTLTHAVSASLDPFTIVILYPLHLEYQLSWLFNLLKPKKRFVDI